MDNEITALVFDFFDKVCDAMFMQALRPEMVHPRTERRVRRTLDEAVEVVSQALERLFVNEQIDAEAAEQILNQLERPLTSGHVTLDMLSEQGRNPDALAEELISQTGIPRNLGTQGLEDTYTLAMKGVCHSLCLLGPPMDEWKAREFPEDYPIIDELLDRVREISQRMDALGKAGTGSEDERFERAYLDYLLQRFSLVETGTVRMTTNIGADLRSLFVQPRVALRGGKQGGEDQDGQAEAEALMDLNAARKQYGDAEPHEAMAPLLRSSHKENRDDDSGLSAAEAIAEHPRCVVVGLPGSGKSTLAGWLQLAVAAGGEGLGIEAHPIPVLLRVRELVDETNLPTVDGMILAATGSAELARRRPGWLAEQFDAGRVLFLLDGLDETSPTDRDVRVLPWLRGLVERYPKCRYIVTSRPVGYPSGWLRKLKFAECDLLDFARAEIAQYVEQWCTAVRVAQGEGRREAQEHGKDDGRDLMGRIEANRYVLREAIVVYRDPEADRAHTSASRVSSRTAKLRRIKAMTTSAATVEPQARTDYFKVRKKVVGGGGRDESAFSFIGPLGVAVVKVTREMLPELAAQSHVAAIMPNQKVFPITPAQLSYETLADDEKEHGITWGLERLGVEELWQTTKGKGVNVAVLDTGTHADHPDLQGKVWRFMVFDPLARRIEAKPPFDSGQHGTHVCGTIAGGNSSGVAIGVAPETNLLVGAALVGQPTLRTLIDAMIWAVEEGADIINMSLGFTYYEPNFSLLMRMLLYDYGVLPVAAIGNENHGNSRCPGNCPEALSVGALQKLPGGQHGVAGFSGGVSLIFPGQQPEQVDKPDVVAPGVDIWSAIPPEERSDGVHHHAYFDGTSMAAPHVSGAAALLMAARPKAPATDIASALKATARHPDGAQARPDNRYGWGEIQPAEALAAV